MCRLCECCHAIGSAVHAPVMPLRMRCASALQRLLRALCATARACDAPSRAACRRSRNDWAPTIPLRIRHASALSRGPRLLRAVVLVRLWCTALLRLLPSRYDCIAAATSAHPLCLSLRIRCTSALPRLLLSRRCCLRCCPPVLLVRMRRASALLRLLPCHRCCRDCFTPFLPLLIPRAFLTLWRLVLPC